MIQGITLEIELNKSDISKSKFGKIRYDKLIR